MDEVLKDALKNVELPAQHQKEEKEPVPFFCPKCAEIRGSYDGGSIMNTLHQRMMWDSFKMCVDCYILTRDHPDQVEANQKAFKIRKEQEEKEKREAEQRKCFRVWLLEPNEKFRNADYVNSISKIAFNKFPENTERGWAAKTKVLIEEHEADSLVELISSKGLTCWKEKFF